MQLLIVGCIFIAWYAELGIEIGVADAAIQGQTRFQLVIQAHFLLEGLVLLVVSAALSVRLLVRLSLQKTVSVFLRIQVRM